MLSANELFSSLENVLVRKVAGRKPCEDLAPFIDGEGDFVTTYVATFIC